MLFYDHPPDGRAHGRWTPHRPRAARPPERRGQAVLPVAAHKGACPLQRPVLSALRVLCCLGARSPSLYFSSKSDRKVGARHEPIKHVTGHGRPRKNTVVISTECQPAPAAANRGPCLGAQGLQRRQHWALAALQGCGFKSSRFVTDVRIQQSKRQHLGPTKDAVVSGQALGTTAGSPPLATHLPSAEASPLGGRWAGPRLGASTRAGLFTRGGGLGAIVRFPEP